MWLGLSVGCGEYHVVGPDLLGHDLRHVVGPGLGLGLLGYGLCRGLGPHLSHCAVQPNVEAQLTQSIPPQGHVHRLATHR